MGVGFEELADEAVGGAAAPDVQFGDLVFDGEGAAGERLVAHGQVAGDAEGAGHEVEATELPVQEFVFADEIDGAEDAAHGFVETEFTDGCIAAAVGAVFVAKEGLGGHFEGLLELTAMRFAPQGVAKTDDLLIRRSHGCCRNGGNRYEEERSHREQGE